MKSSITGATVDVVFILRRVGALLVGNNSPVMYAFKVRRCIGALWRGAAGLCAKVRARVLVPRNLYVHNTYIGT